MRIALARALSAACVRVRACGAPNGESPGGAGRGRFEDRCKRLCKQEAKVCRQMASIREAKMKNYR